MVQNKKNNKLVKELVSNSFVLIVLLSFLLICFAVYYSVFGIKLFEKYEIGNYFYIICVIGILFHFNSLMGTIYRVKNRLFELAFFQSIIPILIFFSMFFAKGKALLPVLLGATLLGNVASLVLFIVNKKISWGGKLTIKRCVEIFNKGFYLFIYNMCFFFIVLSTRTMISYYYEIEDFGYFTFSYTLANAVLLLLQALAIVIFPKIIDKLHSENKKEVKNTINIISENYVTLSYGLMFFVLIIFPFFVNFVPKYQDSLQVLNLIAITVLLFTNSFGFGSHLMAQNKERILSLIAIVSLFLNIALSLLLILVFKVSYEYVIISTLISYFVFSYSCTKYSNRIIGDEKSFFYVILDFFPLRLLIPYLISVVIIVFNLVYLIFLPLLLFIFLNRKTLKQIVVMIKTIITKPNLVDI